LKIKFTTSFPSRFLSMRGVATLRSAARQGGRQLSEPVLFLRALFRNAGAVGAPCASSRYLAEKMASVAPQEGAGVIIEVGAGTGAITKALLASGIAPERLIIIERSPLLFAHLKRRFPTLRVIFGDAADLASFLPSDRPVDAVISSIPFRSLPFATSEKIAEHWRQCLPPGTKIAQYTYALFGPLRHLSVRFTTDASTRVFRNVPPARVVTFRT
jgi:phospholipid N-methyltransferase